MKHPAVALAITLTASAAALAQAVKLPPAFDKLAKKASNTVEVSLDGPMLEAASAFLDPKDKDEALAKKLIAKLKGLYIHSFEFDDDELSDGELDLSPVRDQLKAPQWSRAVSVRSRDGEAVDIYVRHDGKNIGGLVVLSAERSQLTVVDIDGSITPDDVIALSGHFGVPDLNALKKATVHHKDGDE
ncbi:MAG TPA: DUF4252 domain-containing protein [Myxococcaceae bacterium]|nr:DUF4252 domain-containing protein [Myxococcaceae bacterium]